MNAIITEEVFIFNSTLSSLDSLTRATLAFVWWKFLSFMALWSKDMELFLFLLKEKNLLKPAAEDSRWGLTWALKGREEQHEMFRMAGFETVSNHFYLPKTLSQGEVSRCTGWCTGTQPPAVQWHLKQWHQIFSHFKYFFFFLIQKETFILLSSWGKEKDIPW